MAKPEFEPGCYGSRVHALNKWCPLLISRKPKKSVSYGSCFTITERRQEWVLSLAHDYSAMRVRMEPRPQPRPCQSHCPHSLFLFHPCLLLGSSFLKKQIPPRGWWNALTVCFSACSCVQGMCGNVGSGEAQRSAVTKVAYAHVTMPWPSFLTFIVRYGPTWCRQIPEEMESHPLLSALRENILSQAQAKNKLLTVRTSSLTLQCLRNRGRI